MSGRFGWFRVLAWCGEILAVCEAQKMVQRLRVEVKILIKDKEIFIYNLKRFGKS